MVSDAVSSLTVITLWFHDVVMSMHDEKMMRQQRESHKKK